MPECAVGGGPHCIFDFGEWSAPLTPPPQPSLHPLGPSSANSPRNEFLWPYQDPKDLPKQLSNQPLSLPKVYGRL